MLVRPSAEAQRLLVFLKPLLQGECQCLLFPYLKGMKLLQLNVKHWEAQNLYSALISTGN